MSNPTAPARTVAEFVELVKLKAADGLTWHELWELLFSLVALAVHEFETWPTAGPAKKAAVLEQVGQLFDTVEPFVPFPVPYVGVVLKPLLRGTIRKVVLCVASGAVEAVLGRFPPR